MLNSLFLLIVFLLIWQAKRVPGFHEQYLSPQTGINLRGLFALLIVCSHLAQRTNEGFLFHQLIHTGWLSVAVFFFFSGYGLTKKYKDDASYRNGFLQRRLPTVLLPFALAFAVYVALYPPADFTLIGRSLINGEPLLPFSWYILCITYFYILFYVCMHLFGQNLPKLLGAGIVYYFIWFGLCRMLHYPSWWYGSSSALVLGIYWAVYQTQIEHFLRRFYGSICGATVLLFVLIYVANAYFQHSIAPVRVASVFVFVSAIPCLFVLAVLLLCLKYKLGNPVLAALGKISLEIYLVQGIAMALTKPFFTNEFYWCVSVLVLSIILGYLLHISCYFIRKGLRAVFTSL